MFLCLRVIAIARKYNEEIINIKIIQWKTKKEREREIIDDI
jgi:hypothetical protein